MSTKTDVIPQSAATIEITDWKSHQKKTLQGFFSATLPSGLILRRCMLHQKGDSRWVSFPSREWTDAHGVRQFDPLIEFRDRATADRFRDVVLNALDRHLAGGTS